VLVILHHLLRQKSESSLSVLYNIRPRTSRNAKWDNGMVHMRKLFRRPYVHRIVKEELEIGINVIDSDKMSSPIAYNKYA